jgi:hypothetical protein
MIEFTKTFSHILMIPFVESFHINVSFAFAPDPFQFRFLTQICQPIATTALGIVILILNSLIGLILVGLTVLKLGTWFHSSVDHLHTDMPHSGWGTLWYRKKHIAFDSKRLVRQQTPEYDEEDK